MLAIQSSSQRTPQLLHFALPQSAPPRYAFHAPPLSCLPGEPKPAPTSAPGQEPEADTNLSPNRASFATCSCPRSVTSIEDVGRGEESRVSLVGSSVALWGEVVPRPVIVGSFAVRMG